MTLHTKWRRVRGLNILGTRFYDGGQYGLGSFVIEKAYKCKEYSKSALAHDYTHWFDVRKIIVKTEGGLRYSIPWCSWLNAYDCNNMRLSDYYNAQPW